MSVLAIGTRGSALALWQASYVSARLEAAHPGLAVRLEVIKTSGDKILDVPLAKIGGKGLFVKEIEEALKERRVDLAVHSMKDVPAALPEGLAIGAILRRDNPLDAFVSNRVTRLLDLSPGAKVGTSSLRRASQIHHLRPDLAVEPLRGNVDTRLRKLDEGQYDAVILAAAGLVRLGLDGRIAEVLPPEVMLPAIAQGALGIELRAGDARARALVAPLHDEETARCVTAERAFLARLGGGCQVPIAGHATLARGEITVHGLVAFPDGSGIVRGHRTGAAADGEALGRALAEDLLSRGADRILEVLQDSREGPPGGGP